MGEFVDGPGGARVYRACPQRAAEPEDGPAGNSQSWHLALLLAAAAGVTGAHRFYTGGTATGVLWLATLGLLGAGAVADTAAIALSRWTSSDGTPLTRRSARGSAVVAAVAVAWAAGAWLATAAALLLTAATVAALS